MEQGIKKYEDMLTMPHHKSKKHPHMSVADRAAQFSPFAALTGHEDAVKETARVTERRIELSEDQKVRLDERIRFVAEQGKERPEILVTYFQKDQKKEGGSYITVSGRVKKVDAVERRLLWEDGTQISIEDILELDVLQQVSISEL